jgi:GNAT superfamily N-acetyltransferase
MSGERIEEEKVNSEIYYRLILSDGTIACTIKMLNYGLLLYIGSAQKRKGYGRKLYEHVEIIARKNGVKVMRTNDIDSLTECATCFFKAMGFNLKPIENDPQFLEGEKIL